ncbi:TPA: hypothetical protein DDZ06_04695 [Candidatus Uhrbacteria bacterium]|uniref:Uncharacterized protein n=1 Tax=Candidatus Uhrbacteria bacterium GW2011_GWE2_46_68 TaxID=1618994 RepID=A0A0G1Q8H6_9BACT|nr:MAG: hypothetical protein UX57_C0006G0012 [Candidatus Uhrbacteria bacterium GW2011_GWE2_46_68]HBK34283.1 hypothetical protein [Candidatus Uhrbacteria bacterium]
MTKVIVALVRGGCGGLGRAAPGLGRGGRGPGAGGTGHVAIAGGVLAVELALLRCLCSAAATGTPDLEVLVDISTAERVRPTLDATLLGHALLVEEQVTVHLFDRHLGVEGQATAPFDLTEVGDHHVSADLLPAHLAAAGDLGGLCGGGGAAGDLGLALGLGLGAGLQDRGDLELELVELVLVAGDPRADRDQLSDLLPGGKQGGAQLGDLAAEERDPLLGLLGLLDGLGLGFDLLGLHLLCLDLDHEGLDLGIEGVGEGEVLGHDRGREGGAEALELLGAGGLGGGGGGLDDRGGDGAGGVAAGELGQVGLGLGAAIAVALLGGSLSGHLLAAEGIAAVRGGTLELDLLGGVIAVRVGLGIGVAVGLLLVEGEEARVTDILIRQLVDHQEHVLAGAAGALGGLGLEDLGHDAQVLEGHLAQVHAVLVTDGHGGRVDELELASRVAREGPGGGGGADIAAGGAGGGGRHDVLRCCLTAREQMTTWVLHRRDRGVCFLA